MWLKILRWGDDPGLPGGPKVFITRVLITREQTREDGSRVQQRCCDADFENK